MIKLMKGCVKSVNCIISICSISLASHASMELGKNYVIKHFTQRKSHIAILIIIIVTVVHKWASVGLMASHDPLSSLAHLSTDSLWHKMAHVRYFVAQNDPCAFLCERKHVCGSATTDACRFGIPKWLWMALDKARCALQRKIQRVEVHQQWRKATEAKHIYLVIHKHINISVQHSKSIHLICST